MSKNALIAVFMLMAATDAFTLTPKFTPLRALARFPSRCRASKLVLFSDPSSDDKLAAEASTDAPQAPTELYETDQDAVIKSRAESGISNSMKEKLKNELRSQGADANTAFNPYPVLFLGIAVLVVLGGQGILY